MSGDLDREVAHELGEIKATLKGMSSTLEKGALRFDKHEDRIRKVEAKQHWYAGAAAVVGAAGVTILRKMGVM